MSTILLMFLLLGAPDKPLGRPASADVLFRYLPTNADLVLTVDSGTYVPTLYKRFDELAKQPFVTGSPAFLRQLSWARRKLDDQIAEWKQVFGVDVRRASRFVSLALRFVGPELEPQGILVIGGAIPQQTARALARTMRLEKKMQRVGKALLFLADRRSKPGVGWLPGGTLLIGTDAELLRAAKLSGTPKAPQNSLIAKLRTMHGPSVLMSAAFSPPAALKNKIEPEMPSFLRNLLRDFDAIAVSVTPRKMMLKSFSSSSPVLERHKRFFSALGSFVKASHFVAKGMISMVDGLLYDSMTTKPAWFRALSDQRAALVRYLGKMLPDRSIKARVSVKGGHFVQLEVEGATVSLPMFAIFGVGFSFMGFSRPHQVRTVTHPVAPKPIRRSHP
ncbi:MAG: hypothetical protein KC609_04585 [Myxococcales bacterium]|nr:hypothetical protein [Myxococcales bacterium]